MTSTTFPPHRYRCETCTHWDKNKRPHTICQLTNDALEGEDIAFIERHGCCSHSQHQSAEQRIADVIAKLEILAQEAHNKTFAYPTSEEYRLCAKKEELAYDKSIAPLREGK